MLILYTDYMFYYVVIIFVSIRYYYSVLTERFKHLYASFPESLNFKEYKHITHDTKLWPYVTFPLCFFKLYVHKKHARLKIFDRFYYMYDSYVTFLTRTRFTPGEGFTKFSGSCPVKPGVVPVTFVTKLLECTRKVYS